MLTAIAVGVFVIAYDANATLSGGHEIRQHSRGIFMLVGAAVGFFVFGWFGTGARRGRDDREPPPS